MATKKTAGGKTAAKKEAAKPTLTTLLATAGRYYGRTLSGVQGFAETYVLACELYGREARKEFGKKFPMYTDSYWSHIEKVGKHELLPHFLLCSDAMIAGVLRLEDSMTKQMKLIAASSDGKIETVSAKGTIVLKSLSELSRIDEGAIVFAMDSASSPEEIRKFAYAFRQEWRMAKDKAKRDDFERVGDFLRINHAIKSLSKNDWLKMGSLMGWR